MNCFLVLDFLDCISLGLAGGNKVEGCFGAEVLEVLAGAPASVHFLDVGGGEGVGCSCALGGKLDVEAAQRSKVHLVACQYLLAEAAHGILQNALDSAFGEWRVVVCDVLAELVEVEDFAHLCGAVGFRLGDFSLFRARLGTHNSNSVINHKAKVVCVVCNGFVLSDGSRDLAVPRW